MEKNIKGVDTWFDGNEILWKVTVWYRPEDDQYNGDVVATIDGKTGEVHYTDESASSSHRVNEIIKKKVAEIKENEFDAKLRWLLEHNYSPWDAEMFYYALYSGKVTLDSMKEGVLDAEEKDCNEYIPLPFDHLDNGERIDDYNDEF